MSRIVIQIDSTNPSVEYGEDEILDALKANARRSGRCVDHNRAVQTTQANDRYSTTLGGSRCKPPDS